MVEYSNEELKDALLSLGKGGEETRKHIRGFESKREYELSMLQRVTGTRILDYQKNASDAPSMSALLSTADALHDEHGAVVSLLDEIRSQSPVMALAAEFKRASPSKGDIVAPCCVMDAGTRAAVYASAGARVVSILTERHWFKGSLQDLLDARLATLEKRPAILRKDFIVSRYMIAEAAAHGADSVLLIVAILPSDLLQDLIAYSRTLRMEPLVEVHTVTELDVAIHAGARVLGVNNRNLHTFRLDLQTTNAIAADLVRRGLSFRHADHPPSDHVLCALSGMSSADDVHSYRQLGVGMCLIGESLMRSSDPTEAIHGLSLDPAQYRLRNHTDHCSGTAAYIGGTKIVKICGITNGKDALTACRSGANLIGIIFVPKSKRCVSDAEDAKKIVAAVQNYGERSQRVTISTSSIVGGGGTLQLLADKARLLEESCRHCPLVVGVFQDQPEEFIQNMIERCDLDLIQLHGREGMAACKNFSVPAIRVMNICSKEGDPMRMLKGLTSDPMAILLDTSIEGHCGGGTGVAFDWKIAEMIQKYGLPVIIAGGVTPDNVTRAVTQIRPWGVDVCSGVEGERPGKKNGDLVQKFVSHARVAAQEANRGF